MIDRGVFNLGKRKVLSESHLKELVRPQQGELLGRVIKLVGGDNIIVRCTDGKVRTLSNSWKNQAQNVDPGQ
ncbi:hypothetical protein [Nitrososphaera sp. AFS]|uniref:hypothetical protein n=1 Tax=Nitrososphaera sp. AFS TaxID=2301191 RepID=UPI001F1AB5CC|nr:hypothetical protein [Nitrososphaera sp. AFS]